MNPQTKAEFEKLLSKSPNKTCIDCDTFNPQWASVNNGCFMCIKCAGNHRSMGVHITFVRSVTMDGWSKIQLARMKNGGNGKLKKFWKSQQFPKNLTPKQRLDNVAMDKYRERLLSLAKGESPPDIAFIGYQERQILNKSSSDLNRSSFANSSSSSLHSNGSNYSNQSNHNNNNGNRPKMQGFGNTNYNPNDNNNNNNDSWDDFWNSASSFAAKATAVTSDLAQKSKVAAVSLGNKAAEKTATIKNKLGDEEYQANLKKNAAETWSKTTTTLSSWWSTAATSVTNAINENLGDKDGVKLYNRDGIDENKQQESQQSQPGNALYNNNNPNRKKMAALSSDQYFNRNQPQQSQSYGSATNENNDKGKDNISKINVAKEEDILGIDNNSQKMKEKNIDDLEAWNKKNSKKKKKVKTPSDDFDDWGFGDDSDNDNDDDNDKDENNNNSKAKKPEIKPVIDITQAINGVNIDGNNNKKKEKKVESLLDFDKNENNDKGNDGNSSDELDAFFNEMENEKDDDTQNKDKNKNKNKINNKESNDSTMDTNDIDDLLTSHNQTDKNDEPDEWGW